MVSSVPTTPTPALFISAALDSLLAHGGLVRVKLPHPFLFRAWLCKDGKLTVS